MYGSAPILKLNFSTIKKSSPTLLHHNIKHLGIKLVEVELRLGLDLI